jgi:hypothetical protein
MRKSPLGWLAAGAFVCACSAVSSFVTLRPEERTILHIADMAAVRVASDPQYAIGSAGTALVLAKRTVEHGTTVYLYRAAEAGHQTLVLTPREQGRDGCVSCVTVHYFIQVTK